MKRWVLLVVFCVACSDSDHGADVDAGSGPRLGPTFTSIQTNVFDRSCAVSGCHVGGAAPRGLDLSVTKSFQHLVNAQSVEDGRLILVVPGHPESSFLMNKLEGNLHDGQGVRMPFGKPRLPDTTLQTIRDWIIAGALND